MKWRATCSAYKKPEQAAETSKQTAFAAPIFFCTKQAVEGKNMSGVTVATVLLPPPRVVRLRSRWGSCAASGRITLNVGLVLLAPALIDYVLLHELCHLRELNHGPRFYAVLAAALPDHRQRQQALRGERPWRPLLP